MHLTGHNTAQEIKVKGDAVSKVEFDRNKLLTTKRVPLWHNLLHCAH